MPISPARAAAFDILLKVERADAYASDLLHSRCVQLFSIDRALSTELVMGVLRWRSWLDERIASCASQPLAKLDAEVLTALRLAAYQLEFLERVPQRAAVHESVELVKRGRKKSAAAFVNAVLRKMADHPGSAPQTLRSGKLDRPDREPPQRTRRSLDAICSARTGGELSHASAHPAWLVERWVANFGLDAARKICEHDQRVPQTSVRIAAGTLNQAELEGARLAPGRLVAAAKRVESGDVTATKAFQLGRIAIQDEASQLVALLVGHGTNILDCCAAPGGKTRLIADKNPDARILALELHPHRASALRKLVSAQNVRVIVGDARELPSNARFDCILADAPCSGTGTLARNPEIKWKLRSGDLADLRSRQLAILQSAMAHLQPGGRVVYATCSLEPEENEQVVEKALASDGSCNLLDCRAELEKLRLQGELIWPDVSSLIRGVYLRTIPGVHPCDGFFATIIGRT